MTGRGARLQMCCRIDTFRLKKVAAAQFQYSKALSLPYTTISTKNRIRLAHLVGIERKEASWDVVNVLNWSVSNEHKR